MKRILFVDDEIDPRQSAEPRGGYMWYYIEALRERGVEVVPATTTAEAMHRLESDAQFDLLVLDVMMPPGNVLDPKLTRGGMRSGVLLADLIADKAPDLPIMVLTNVLDRAEHEELRKKKTVCGVFFKPYCTPISFGREVASVLGD